MRSPSQVESDLQVHRQVQRFRSRKHLCRHFDERNFRHECTESFNYERQRELIANNFSNFTHLQQLTSRAILSPLYLRSWKWDNRILRCRYCTSRTAVPHNELHASLPLHICKYTFGEYNYERIKLQLKLSQLKLHLTPNWFTFFSHENYLSERRIFFMRYRES